MGSSAPATAGQTRISRFVWRAVSSTLGAKVIVAVTGVVLVGFLVTHLAGNLLVYGGPDALNQYAMLLRVSPELLWLLRGGLIVSAALHVFFTVRLTDLSAGARSEGYRTRRWRQASLASRFMIVSGVVVLVFLVFHLFHFTFGWILPEFYAVADPLARTMNVYAMVVRAFHLPWVVAVYVVGMIAVGFHLWHGVWSMFQTLGFGGRRSTPFLKAIGIVLTVAIVAGLTSIPIVIQAGLVTLP